MATPLQNINQAVNAYVKASKGNDPGLEARDTRPGGDLAELVKSALEKSEDNGHAGERQTMDAVNNRADLNQVVTAVAEAPGRRGDHQPDPLCRRPGVQDGGHAVAQTDCQGDRRGAHRIRDVAEENDIPVVENPPLARALYSAVELDEEIPPEHYKAVAEVIGYVMRLKGKMPPQ
jgi:type III secretion system FlhB-like substrate exporter/flagellar hook-basal body complex protein FliE